MLAASWRDGLTRSDDTGGSWQPIPNTPFPCLGALVIDPHDSSLVLGSSPLVEAGIYRSVDGGSTWTLSAAGIVGMVRALAFSADGAEVFASGDSGLFRSTDAGRTWQRVEEAPVLLQVPEEHAEAALEILEALKSEAGADMQEADEAPE